MSSPTKHTGLACIALALAATAVTAQESHFAVRFFGTGVDQLDRAIFQVDDDAPGEDLSAPTDVGAGDFTIEFWLRGALADNTTGHAGGDVVLWSNEWIDGNIIVDRDIWGGSNRDFGISIAGGFVRFGTGTGDGPFDPDVTIEGNVDVLDDSWHHVACVRDATIGQLSVYVDGALDIASPTGVSTTDLSYPDDGAPGAVTAYGPFLVIAAEKHDAGPDYPSFSGYFDELRIWNLARSALQIDQARNLVVPPDSPGLVADYRFEEGSGTVLHDTSTTGAPIGQLVAGESGNGEWTSYALDPTSTAPLTLACGADGYGWSASPVNTLTLTTSGGVLASETLEVHVGSMGSATIAWLLPALSEANVPFLDGVLLVLPVPGLLPIPLVGSGGTATFELDIPTAPALLGLPLHFQAAAPDTAQPQDIALSNGVRAVLCP